MTNIKILPWSGRQAYETEATAADGRFLSLYIGPLPDCPWGRWFYSVDTCENAGDHELRPLATGIEYTPDDAKSAAQAAARSWLRASLKAIN